MHEFMSVQNEGFAWDDTERGHFKEEYFPPVTIPAVEHTPWIQKNIPIPPGIFDQVCKIIKTKIDAGSIRAIKLLIPLSLVLCSKEGWKESTTRTQLGATKRSDYKALRCAPGNRRAS